MLLNFLTKTQTCFWRFHRKNKIMRHFSRGNICHIVPNIFPGREVLVYVKELPNEQPGIVQYKGELPPNLRPWFEVELRVSIT